MTSQEFIDDIRDMSDLLRCCYDYELYDYTDEYVDEDGLNEHINNMLQEAIGEYGWRTIYNTLSNIDDIYGHYIWYHIDGWDVDGVSETGDEYEELKQEIYDYLFDNNLFDDDPLHDEGNDEGGTANEYHYEPVILRPSYRPEGVDEVGVEQEDFGLTELFLNTVTI